MTAEKWKDELAKQLMISPQAISEAIRRGLVSFKKYRGVRCWRFGDQRNGCLRRLDGQPFQINGERVKVTAETRGEAWHRLIGLDDVSTNDRREILLIIEGSKDALAALHFADAEARLSQIGVVAALGSAVKPTRDDIEKLRGRRLRLLPDVDAVGQEAAVRIGQAIATLAVETQIFDLKGLCRDDGEPVNDLFDVTRISYDDFEANRDLWSVALRVKAAASALVIAATRLTNAHAKSNEPIRLLTNLPITVIIGGWPSLTSPHF
jgi:hypothetical protein